MIQAHTRATAFTASEFLDTLQHRMPFPIRAVQVDGGSEFAAEFEPACQQRGLHWFVLPPRSPKLNGTVERANRTPTEEFYQVTACSREMKKLNRELRNWERIYNTVRPHQALGYLTPQQFLRQISSQRKECKVSPILWTSTRPFAVKEKLLRCFRRDFPYFFFLAIGAFRSRRYCSPLRKLWSVCGRLAGNSARLGKGGAICATYAICASPHKHWRLRILLIWRVGT